MTDFTAAHGKRPGTTLRPLTCGLLVRSPAGWLLGHATNTDFWDLPKGKREYGEPALDAALRECREETGLDFSADRARIQDLGALPYNKKLGRTLHLFVLDVPEAFSLAACHCETLVHTRGPQAVPDMDAYAWIPAQAVADHVKRRMAKYLARQGLLEPAGAKAFRSSSDIRDRPVMLAR